MRPFRNTQHITRIFATGTCLVESSQFTTFGKRQQNNAHQNSIDPEKKWRSHRLDRDVKIHGFHIKNHGPTYAPTNPTMGTFHRSGTCFERNQCSHRRHPIVRKRAVPRRSVTNCSGVVQLVQLSQYKHNSPECRPRNPYPQFRSRISKHAFGGIGSIPKYCTRIESLHRWPRGTD